eukprot:GDKK01010055.1.p1 GENE.GDKK01010055.1~~GDKK01010055.1.p1  ORF type:complete len:116 (+),score=27.45 GDKK01010055.1:55-402(+)
MSGENRRPMIKSAQTNKNNRVLDLKKDYPPDPFSHPTMVPVTLQVVNAADSKDKFLSEREKTLRSEGLWASSAEREARALEHRGFDKNDKKTYRNEPREENSTSLVVDDGWKQQY